jgi:hypothetical protein
MTTALSSADRNRLTAILGMLGSDASGERDNAARLAETFRREHGLTVLPRPGEWVPLSAQPGNPLEKLSRRRTAA